MFDFGFTKFITNTWISFIWALIVVVHILIYIGGLPFVMIVTANSTALDVVSFFVFLIGIPLSLLFSRMSLEAVVVLFRIETHLRTISEKYENK